MFAGGRHWRILLLSVGTLLWFIIGGELLSRFEDAWRITSLRLEPRNTSGIHIQAESVKVESIASLTYQDGVNPAWFLAPPPRLDKIAHPELLARTLANPTGMQQENYLWNSALLAHPEASQVALIRGFKEDTLFSFPSYDGSPYPRYRLYPDNDFRPTPWVTNHWGWLSVDMTVRKPARTVRVGIIGDSTSHNRYGLYLQAFLNAWAQSRHIDTRFEVANTGRQGFGFEDGLAAMKYELGPMSMDYVVEYFAPAFSLVRAQMAQFATSPPGTKVDAARHWITQYMRRMLAPVAPYSALVHRLDDQDTADSSGLLSEPVKPHVVLHLPSDTAGQKMSMGDARKDPYFAKVADRLDHFKALAESLHSTPFVSTERLCVWDGMMLRKGADQRLYEILNGPAFWPFSYADVRRMLNAHNSTISAWAQANGIHVIDIDGRMPQRADLCQDAWHDNEIGQRMRAWLIFQAMIPQIALDLKNTLAPHNSSINNEVHPYLDKQMERIDRPKWLSRIESPHIAANSAK